MIVLLTTMIAAAKTDVLVTHLESRSYRQNGKILVVSTDKVVLSRLEDSALPHEALPKLGDLDKEVRRLQNKYGTTCVIEIAPQDKGIDSPVPGIRITERGTCTMDDNIRYSIKDNGALWTVVDNEGDEVTVHTFANVCEDVPLLLRLEHEQNISRRNGKILEWGATGLAITGLFTMGNPDPGFSAREQNRFWTSVFLFGTSAILYTQRDTPFVYMTDSQNSLSNYHSRDSAERILLKTFGLPPEDTLDNTNVEEISTEDTSSNPEGAPEVPTSETTDTSTDKSDDTLVLETPASDPDIEPNESIESTPEDSNTKPNPPPSTPSTTPSNEEAP